ncbi:methyltransferase domain-containing protein [Ramlibacter albus]|uniref:Class I SAM-dependent methyltransferase n=1 Tax=Ramlibacter albus TaxID=2079448 RepID=A0A923M534_9BURK|nr:class I SAM-dependent methyltransferase [Ramlibacter albus]MBC5764058.1 class I SAM-dependent methyltransferase [Ramlibacter albus]
MHDTAIDNGKAFFDTYLVPGTRPRLLDIGALDVNGSLRAVCPKGVEYIGVDFAQGPGVDVVLTDPYALPFPDKHADVIVTSSCFEHSEMFWVLFIELLRVLKPHGLLYLNAPSNGAFHRYPVDCWRFYPDSGRALVTWAKRCGLKPALLESYISGQSPHNPWGWNDFVAVFVKDEAHAGIYPRRILQAKQDVFNGVLYGLDGFVKFFNQSEDMRKLRASGAHPQAQLPVE